MRLFSNVWSENTALFERLMEIHSNSPKLYYGFNVCRSEEVISFFWCSVYIEGIAMNTFTVLNMNLVELILPFIPIFLNHFHFLMPRSHLHVNPSCKSYERQLSWNSGIWLPRGSYRVFLTIKRSSWLLHGAHGNLPGRAMHDPVTAKLTP